MATNGSKPTENLVEQRKRYIDGFINSIETAVKKPNCEITCATGRITTTADSFDIEIKNVDKNLVTKYLEDTLIPYELGKEGRIKIFYPKHLEAADRENANDPLLKFFQKERETVIRVLKNKNYLLKKGGSTNKGSYGINNASSMVTSKKIVVTTANNNATTLKQLLKCIEAHYGNVKGVTIQSASDQIHIEFGDDALPKAGPPAQEGSTQGHSTSNEPVAEKLTGDDAVYKEMLSDEALHLMKGLKGVMDELVAMHSPLFANKFFELMAQEGLAISVTNDETRDGQTVKVTRQLSNGEIQRMLLEPVFAIMKTS